MNSTAFILLWTLNDNMDKCLQRWQDSGWRVRESDVVGRRDLRRERAMSVDPPGCQDIDDAMHVTRKPNGKLEVRTWKLEDIAQHKRRFLLNKYIFRHDIFVCVYCTQVSGWVLSVFASTAVTDLPTKKTEVSVSGCKTLVLSVCVYVVLIVACVEGAPS